MRAANVQASLHIRAVSPEPLLLAHTSSESRGTFRQKTRSLAPLNGWTCAVEICHDGMLKDTNSLDGALSGFICLFIWFEILYIVSGPTVLPIVARLDGLNVSLLVCNCTACLFNAQAQ